MRALFEIHPSCHKRLKVEDCREGRRRPLCPRSIYHDIEYSAIRRFE